MTIPARVVAIIRPIAYVLGGLIALVFYVLAIWHAPEFLVNRDVLSRVAPEQRLQAEHNARLIVISVGGALVVGTGLLYTARNYRLAHRGQVTERFTKALERLGSEELYVRIGGVHALEHVMRDSSEHHGDTVEVLVAFIRDQAPRRSTESVPVTQWMHPPIEPGVAALPEEPAADVQAALTALGRRPDRAGCERAQINLCDLHLEGAQLKGARLAGVNLSNTQLHRADLRAVELQRADLRGTQLLSADLVDAQLQQADLRGAQLQGALLVDAQLQHADLRGARLQGAVLVEAHLYGTDLVGAEIQGESLRRARLRGAMLTEAQFRDAVRVAAAELQGESLTGMRLQRATLIEAHFQGVILTKTEPPKPEAG
ncbi:pentapeptide repeat-containing protein [Lentzea terrae]|uniref:pentapeptide repeat-containing protein n=1 Tax=Lentzea terrae TaxID=2200761 RepID=UPI0013005360|nr:pentapeptide repeat-containing protein [Lentzea terrae]